MLSRKGKFYKYSIALVLSLVLSFCFIGKSVEAATSIAWTFNVGFGGGNIMTYATTANPEAYLVSEVAEGPDLVTDTYNYKFRFSFPVTIQFTQGAGAADEYRGGYVNGLLRCNLVLPVVLTGLTSTRTNIRFDVDNEFYISDTLETAIVSRSVSNSQLTLSIVTYFNNWSLPVQATVNRYLNLGQVVVTYEFESVQQPTSVAGSVTPSVTVTSSYIECTATARAGQGIAGQIYTAIENSTSVEEIIDYLSLIEDASGDLNVAVAHINEQLLPSVIGYLANIYTHTATMNQTTQNIRSYLYAISSTWPDYSAQVLFYLQQLVEMNQEQSSIAEQYQQEYSSKAAQSASEAAGMQAVLPNVSASDFDVGSQLDSGTVTTLSAFWAMFPNNSLIGTLFAIAIAGIAAGYFLYGKKS